MGDDSSVEELIWMMYVQCNKFGKMPDTCTSEIACRRISDTVYKLLVYLWQNARYISVNEVLNDGELDIHVHVSYMTL